jgi:hypothetical protein
MSSPSTPASMAQAPCRMSAATSSPAFICGQSAKASNVASTPPNLADLIREHTPYAFAIVEQVGARSTREVEEGARLNSDDETSRARAIET